ncbi:MAG: gamma carbonic anhydrase family protein, partial [Gemmatimonadales bacterium]
CRNALVGMNAVVMDDAIVGPGSIVGALCFVPAEMEIPERKVVVGNPARILKDVTDEMLEWKTEGTALYQALPAELHRSLQEADPLRDRPDLPEQQAHYRTWRDRRQEGEDQG